MWIIWWQHCTAALTAAEVLAWAQTGRLPTWCENATGSMVAQTSGTLTPRISAIRFSPTSIDVDT